jgi:transposase
LLSKYSSVNIYSQDESRFGLFTRNGSAITARGVKPVCPYQHKFENTYLFGAFSAINGSSFLLELPNCNTETFQIFIDEFSQENPTELKVIVLDNGSFHKSKRLKIPENIILIFLPAYSPELNPAEKVWWLLKREFVCQTFVSMNELQKHITTSIKKIIQVKTIKSLCSFKYLACEF